jgi:hypothetical protein
VAVLLLALPPLLPTITDDNDDGESTEVATFSAAIVIGVVLVDRIADDDAGNCDTLCLLGPLEAVAVAPEFSFSPLAAVAAAVDIVAPNWERGVFPPFVGDDPPPPPPPPLPPPEDVAADAWAADGVMVAEELEEEVEAGKEMEVGEVVLTIEKPPLESTKTFLGTAGEGEGEEEEEEEEEEEGDALDTSTVVGTLALEEDAGEVEEVVVVEEAETPVLPTPPEEFSACTLSGVFFPPPLTFDFASPPVFLLVAVVVVAAVAKVVGEVESSTKN